MSVFKSLEDHNIELVDRFKHEAPVCLEYVRHKNKAKYTCTCGNHFQRCPMNVLDKNRKSIYCFSCSPKFGGGLKTLEFHNNELFVKFEKESPICLKYVGSNTKSVYKCKCGKLFHRTPTAVLFVKSIYCLDCSPNLICKKTTEQYNVELVNKFGDKAPVCLKYISVNKKSEHRCYCGNVFSRNPKNILHFNRIYCEECSVYTRHENNFIQSELIPLLESNDISYTDNQKVGNGVPDLEMVINGEKYFIEVKMRYGRITNFQKQVFPTLDNLFILSPEGKFKCDGFYSISFSEFEQFIEVRTALASVYRGLQSRA